MSSDLFGLSELHDPGCKRVIRVPADVMIDAEFGGPNGCYRPKLSHRWAPGPMILWCMMNPSAADERNTDATVNKTGRISRSLGFGGQFIGNAADYRATDPLRLLTVPEPVSARNLAAIGEMAACSTMIIVAHGKLPGRLQPLAVQMVAYLRAAGYALHTIGRTADGTPMHPLARGRAHIPESIVPQLWKGPECSESTPICANADARM